MLLDGDPVNLMFNTSFLKFLYLAFVDNATSFDARLIISFGRRKQKVWNLNCMP